MRHSHNAQVSNVERSNTRAVILLPRICGKIGFPTYQCFERKRSKGGNTPIGLGVRFSHSLLKAAGKETFLRLFLLSGCADNAAYFSQSSQFSYDGGTEMDFRVASLEWNTDLCRFYVVWVGKRETKDWPARRAGTIGSPAWNQADA